MPIQKVKVQAYNEQTGQVEEIEVDSQLLTLPPARQAATINRIRQLQTPPRAKTQAPPSIASQIAPTIAQLLTPAGEAGGAFASGVGELAARPLTEALELLLRGWAHAVTSPFQSSSESLGRAYGAGVSNIPGTSIPMLNPSRDVAEQIEQLSNAIPVLGPILGNVRDVYQQQGALPAMGRATGEGLLMWLLGKMMPNIPSSRGATTPLRPVQPVISPTATPFSETTQAGALNTQSFRPTIGRTQAEQNLAARLGGAPPAQLNTLLSGTTKTESELVAALEEALAKTDVPSSVQQLAKKGIQADPKGVKVWLPPSILTRALGLPTVAQSWVAVTIPMTPAKWTLVRQFKTASRTAAGPILARMLLAGAEREPE